MISTPGPDAERLRRIADNEALFRSVNERVQEINDAFAPSTDRFEIVCECGDIQCTEQISVSPSAYEAVRAESALFFASEEANFLTGQYLGPNGGNVM